MFADFSKRPWFTKTLYDLPENYERFKELLPIGLRKGFDSNIPDLTVRKMSVSSEKSRPIYGECSLKWASRVDEVIDVPPMKAVREMLIRPSFSMTKPEFNLRRPNFKPPS